MSHRHYRRILEDSIQELSGFDKGEDEQKYKDRAKHGMDLMFPVTIKDRTHRPDINMPYHSTIKLFEPDKDKTEEVHNKASQLNLVPPNPSEVGIEPTTLKGRSGNIMHVLKLLGPHADVIRQHNKHFEGHGEPTPVFDPHVTVDKDTWDAVVSSGAKTAADAGIQFHPAELRHRDRVLSKYPHKVEKTEEMEKGLKHVAAAMGVAGALAMNPKVGEKEPVQSSMMPSISQEAPAPQRKPASIPKAAATQYNHKKMLDTIAQVESAGGKLTHHKPTSQGTAYGKYGLMPNVIKETIHMHPDLRHKYGRAMALQGQDLHNYMRDNPGLEDAIADRHLQRLEHHFGQDHNKVGFAWNQGIRGTYHAEPNKLNEHPYTKKISTFYSKVK